MNISHLALGAAACLATAAPGFAQETKVGRDRYAMVVHQADLHPATPAAARRAVARIDAAALRVCGASSFTLREIIAAKRRSPCWREAMAGAMTHASDPLLLDAYKRRF